MTYFGAYFDEVDGRAWMLQDTAVSSNQGRELTGYSEKMYYHPQSNTLFGGLGGTLAMCGVMAMLHGSPAPEHEDALEGAQIIMRQIREHDSYTDPEGYADIAERVYALGFNRTGAAQLTSLDQWAGDRRFEPEVSEFTARLLDGFSDPVIDKHANTSRSCSESHSAPLIWKINRKLLPAPVLELVEDSLAAHDNLCERGGQFGIGGELLAWSTDAAGNFRQQVVLAFPEQQWHDSLLPARGTTAELLKVLPEGVNQGVRINALWRAGVYRFSQAARAVGMADPFSS